MMNQNWFLFDIFSEFCRDDYMLESCPTFTFLYDLFSRFTPLRLVKDVPEVAGKGVLVEIGQCTVVAEVKECCYIFEE